MLYGAVRSDALESEVLLATLSKIRRAQMERSEGMASSAILTRACPKYSSKSRRRNQVKKQQKPEQRPEPVRSARSTAIAEKGISTSRDEMQMMSSLISDLSSGRITPKVADSICNATGKMLKVVELEAKFGVTAQNGGRKLLRFVESDATGN
jgi:hypothetical protein